MARTCCEAERAINHNGLYQAVRNSVLRKFGVLSTSESIASSAVKTAIDVKAKGIIVISESGKTAGEISKFRAGKPIVVLTTRLPTARQSFGWLRGVHTKLLPSIDQVETIVRETIDEFKAAGSVSAGEPIVIVHGTTEHVGSTNTMKIVYA
eukprot:CAMPEP_0195517394 /NCGR_PEP_ID=MMETSP0794_2-20130614/10659_1 /TAXON_ID=515487 /ORGANISM="Stephanopyxis turris, Strain CCMP 815" /LENGTH=151 /DNA_ID=CAMNT_0040646195 /DNA_START=17 /DNA_END=472 /DNA_ORIENTATION=-